MFCAVDPYAIQDSDVTGKSRTNFQNRDLPSLQRSIEGHSSSARRRSLRTRGGSARRDVEVIVIDEQDGKEEEDLSKQSVKALPASMTAKRRYR